MTAPVERKAEAAVEADIPHLVKIFYDAFTSDRFRATFPDTDGGRRWVHHAFETFLGPRNEGGPETQVIVSRGPEGKPVALAIYRIWQAGSDPSSRTWRARWPLADGYPDMNNDTLDEFLGPPHKSRNFLMGDRAHIFLEALGTLPDHQKQGHGKVLVKWGTELADELGVECYLEASLAGQPLYLANGYIPQDVSAAVRSEFLYPMVRPAKPHGL